MDRRNFIKTSVAASTATLTAASLLESCGKSTTAAPSYQGKRLVLISLDGGHDGLHAMAPRDNEMMMKLRPKIYADTRQQGIPISLTGNTEFILHRNLKSLMPSIEKGDLRIIPNAGLPLNEWNGSHFVSQDFWSTAEYHGNRNPVGVNGTGWIGRLLERPNMNIGHFQRTAIALEMLTPLVLKGKKISGVAWPGLDASATIKSQLDTWLNEVPPIENNSVYREMADLSMIYQWLNQTQPMPGFPSSRLGQQLAHAASLILGDHPFKVIKCSEGGFDTHNGQLENHQNSYPKLSASISAFYEFLKTHRLLEQTLVVIYSEFGRTIYENSAMGTEHGTAGPIFVIGGQKNTLLEFTNVSFKFETETLNETTNTEYLKHQVDFRNVFKNIQESWLDCVS